VLQPDEWRTLIVAAGSLRPVPVLAHTFRRAWASTSRPVELACDDGFEYVVKGQQAGRSIVSDQLIGRLGIAMEAPVAPVALVDVPAELIALQLEMSHFQPGIAHGSRRVPDCSLGREGFRETSLPQNRDRFARLAILYGWVIANDYQFIYDNGPPPLVHSVDHGDFLPGGEDWTVSSLTNTTSTPAALDHMVMTVCSCKPQEIAEAAAQFRSIDDTVLAEAVSAPPDTWGCSLDERVALAEFLSRRREELLALIDRIP
jgi:hypothetical protein